MRRKRPDRPKIVGAVGCTLRELRLIAPLTPKALGDKLDLKPHRIREYEEGLIEPGAILWCDWVHACTGIDPRTFWLDGHGGQRCC